MPDLVPTNPLRVAPPAAPVPAWHNFGGVPQRDPLALLMQDAKTDATRRTYKTGLKHFFGGDFSLEQTIAFLSLDVTEIARTLSAYTTAQRAAGVPGATINSRVAAVRALINAGKKYGFCAFDSRFLIKSEKVEAYRDTAGTGLENIQKLIAAPGTATLKGKRDTAILSMMFTIATRRAGVCSLDVSHFDRAGSRIAILGKGKADRKWKPLDTDTCAAIQAYLAAAGHQDGALFRNCHRDPAVAGQRMTTRGLYEVVGYWGRKIGLPALTPHKIRHSAITITLDESGDLLEAQGLSDHVDQRTLAKYDDNRKKRGSKATKMLADLLYGRIQQTNKAGDSV
jgi:integrase/recombinase XerC